MMRNHSAALAFAALLCSTQATAAAPQNGVLSGLSVTWGGVNALSIQPGEGYVAGNQYTGNDINYAPFAAAQLAMGVALTANTAYYIYACWDTSATIPAFTPHPITATVIPFMGGLPSGALKTSTGDVCDGLFLGSIVTESTSSLVPFVRSGEDVILSLVPYTVGGPVCDAGTQWVGAGAAPINFSRGGATCVLVPFDSLGDLSCNGKDSSGQNLDLPYPQSASALLVDFSLSNFDLANHYVEVPYATPNPVGPTTLSNYQLKMLYNESLPCQLTDGGLGTCPFIDYYSHTRVNPTIDAGVNIGHTPPAPVTTAQFWVCIDGMPDAGPVSGYAIYRGYVESIGHMTHE